MELIVPAGEKEGVADHIGLLDLMQRFPLGRQRQGALGLALFVADGQLQPVVGIKQQQGLARHIGLGILRVVRAQVRQLGHLAGGRVQRGQRVGGGAQNPHAVGLVRVVAHPVQVHQPVPAADQSHVLIARKGGHGAAAAALLEHPNRPDVIAGALEQIQMVLRCGGTHEQSAAVALVHQAAVGAVRLHAVHRVGAEKVELPAGEKEPVVPFDGVQIGGVGLVGMVAVHLGGEGHVQPAGVVHIAELTGQAVGRGGLHVVKALLAARPLGKQLVGQRGGQLLHRAGGNALAGTGGLAAAGGRGAGRGLAAACQQSQRGGDGGKTDKTG